jgi:hypothetical protein
MAQQLVAMFTMFIISVFIIGTVTPVNKKTATT